MRYAFTSLAFGFGASAAILPRDSCTFTLTASGGQSGPVGQLSDGQNRIGGGNPQGTYSINNGQITDAEGRGCILTPSITQFQCDTGATPTGGFSIGSNGDVEYNNSATFYACPASDIMYNIYTTPVSGQDKCVKVGLTASGCYGPSSSAVKSSQPTSKPITPVQQATTYQAPQDTKTTVQTAQQSCPPLETKTITEVKTVQGPTITQVKSAGQSCPAPSTITKTEQITVTPSTKETQTPSLKPSTEAPVPSKSQAPAPSPSSGSSKTCPTNLSGNYQYPHLIIPISQSSPDKAEGTSYNGKISSDVSSIFNFDIPSSYTGTCSLVFLFPEQSQLETSSYTFEGNGEFDFKQLSNIASQSTTYANQGGVKSDFGVKTATPGSSVVVSTFACPTGQTVSYEISSSSGSSLEYFQDYNPSPIGLYITSC